jgi:branched-chain amino acid transport system permease protein
LTLKEKSYMDSQKRNWWKVLFFGVIAAFLLIFPILFTLPFPQHIMIMIFLYATLAQAWNIIGGYAGQISLGHAVYFGCGAYTSTLLLIHGGISPWLGMLAGAGLATGLSQIIGYPCFRLAGHYFAIATIAIGEIAQISMVNWKGGGGAVGLYVPMLEESFANLEFHTTKVPYYYIALGITAITFFVAYLIERSWIGFYLRAIKGDLDASRSLGINIPKYKSIALAISAFFTAVCGTFYAQYVLFIDPESVLPLMLSILISLVAILGGVATVWGPFLGAMILVPLSEFTRTYLGGGGQAIDLMIYGALIVVIARFQAEGLMGWIKKFR